MKRKCRKDIKLERTRQGAVGSSINQGLISASLLTYSTACGTSHIWFASIISTFPVGPAFFPSMLLGLGGFLPLDRLAGSSMMERVASPRWRSDSALADVHLKVAEALMKRFER